MSPDKPSTVPVSTIRGDEVARFERLAATWWNSEGPMRPLHVINALRLGYVLEQIACCFGRPVGDLHGLRIADIGCGAGLMCEPLAARGAQVVGVDAAAKSIAAAQLHAGAGRLSIDYRIGEPDTALRDGESFDVLLLLEVVEHVDNVQGFVREAARRIKPGGLLLASTINRTARSFVTAIVGAEHVFRVLPRGTHHWAQFVRPDELEQAAQAGGLNPQDRRGMRYMPVVHRAWWTRDLSVNYIASFTRDLSDDRSQV
jgi:2-polyprenyl-6-hydroxyphenyl methylase / 3-demethylubiquinone-9 3-methyltransferase